MRITVLWSSLAGYSVAFFKELVRFQNCEIQLIFLGATPQAPYENFDLSFCSTAINRCKSHDNDIAKAVFKFSPDCVLMSSWNFPDYMKIAKRLRSEGVFVVSTIDHQWEGTLKQWLGVVSSRWFLKPSIDCFLVTGDRQAYFAHKLGYDRILYGLYAAAVEEFRSAVPLCDRDPSFLFVGRLSAEKGLENLLTAYRMYRKQCASPWDLKVAGTGQLQSLLDDTAGVKPYGFVQPADLPALMQSARALILPSSWEPWGVVIHEAAAAGLPIIATYQCGAVTAFVRDGINGFVVQPFPQAIMDAMLKLSSLEADELECWGKASRTLAELWTPRKQARYFVNSVDFLINSLPKLLVR